MKKIALIDNNVPLIEHYRYALAAVGFEVAVFNSVSECIAHDFDGFDLIVCDLMMPDEGYFANTGTSDGLLTGLRLIDTFRSKGCTVPAVILTALNIDFIFRSVKEEVNSMSDVIILSKSDYNTIEFADIAMSIIDKTAFSNLSSDFRKRLFDSISVSLPLFPGVNINLKKLFGVEQK